MSARTFTRDRFSGVWQCDACGLLGEKETYRQHECAALTADDVRRIVREELERLREGGK